MQGKRLHRVGGAKTRRESDMADNGDPTNTEPTSRTFSSTAAGSPDSGASAASSQGDPETVGTGNETMTPSSESGQNSSTASPPPPPADTSSQASTANGGEPPPPAASSSQASATEP